MQLNEATVLGPGDQIYILSDDDAFTVMAEPEIRGKGIRAFARITACDSFGRTRIFSNDELASIRHSKHVGRPNKDSNGRSHSFFRAARKS